MLTLSRDLLGAVCAHLTTPEVLLWSSASQTLRSQLLRAPGAMAVISFSPSSRWRVALQRMVDFLRTHSLLATVHTLDLTHTVLCCHDYSVYDLLPQFPRLQRLSFYGVALNVTVSGPDPADAAPQSTPVIPFALGNPAFFWSPKESTAEPVFALLHTLNLSDLGIAERSMCALLRSMPALETLLMPGAVCQSTSFSWGDDESVQLFATLRSLRHLRVLDISGRNLQPNLPSIMRELSHVPLVYAYGKRVITALDPILHAPDGGDAVFVVLSPSELMSTVEEHVKCRALMRYITNVDAVSDRGLSLFMDMCRDPSFPMESLQLLLEMGSNPRQVLGVPCRPVNPWVPEFPHNGDASALGSRQRTVRRLYGMSAVTGFTPLHMACSSGRVAVVQLLLGLGVDVNARAQSGVTPLTLAVASAYTNGADCLHAMLQAPLIAINQADERGWTALHYAATCSSVGGRGLAAPVIVKILCEAGANKEAALADSELAPTPILLAASRGLVDVCAELLALGAVPHPYLLHVLSQGPACMPLAAMREPRPEWQPVVLQRDEDGDTALLHAIKYGTLEQISALLDGVAGIEAAFGVADTHGLTPLHAALLRPDCLDVATRLVAAQSDLATRITQLGESPLAIACRAPHGKLPPHLLAALALPAMVNLADANGVTPLHGAALLLHCGLITSLLACGADPNAADAKGLTPLTLACIVPPLSALKIVDTAAFRPPAQHQAQLQAQLKFPMIQQHVENSFGFGGRLIPTTNVWGAEQSVEAAARAFRTPEPPVSGAQAFRFGDAATLESAKATGAAEVPNQSKPDAIQLLYAAMSPAGRLHRDSSGRTFLHHLVGSSSDEQMRSVLQGTRMDASVLNAADEHGVTPLMMLCAFAHHTSLEYCLGSVGPALDWGVTSSLGWTCLLAALNTAQAAEVFAARALALQLMRGGGFASCPFAINIAGHAVVYPPAFLNRFTPPSNVLAVASEIAITKTVAHVLAHQDAPQWLRADRVWGVTAAHVLCCAFPGSFLFVSTAPIFLASGCVSDARDSQHGRTPLHFLADAAWRRKMQYLVSGRSIAAFFLTLLLIMTRACMKIRSRTRRPFCAESSSKAST